MGEYINVWFLISSIYPLLRFNSGHIDDLNINFLWAVVWERRLVKCERSFIGCSDSNHSAFYLYKANSARFYSTSCQAHAWMLKGCGLCMVMSLTLQWDKHIKNIWIGGCAWSILTIFFCHIYISQLHRHFNCGEIISFCFCGYLNLSLIQISPLLAFLVKKCHYYTHSTTCRKKWN